MKVINHTDSTLTIEGIYIPAGQHRNVRSLDFGELPERVQARLEAGDISIPGLGDATPQVEGAFDDEPEPRRFGGFFSRDSDDGADEESEA